ncbi:hypothetical protein [Acidithiobacillus sp.]|uniref:hypothetical protein n=1 Tax=Acidithiobacillus sp. TaxID=1872118 RepID=UPI0032B01609
MMRWLLLDILLALLASFLASFLVPVIDRKGRRLAAALFFLLAVALPLIGALLALVYALALRSVAHRVRDAEVEPIRVPPPARDFRLRPSPVAPGAITARLQGARDSQQRVEALSQIMSSRFAEQLRLLRSALRDEAEEVRLLAYAALDQREQENTEMLVDLQRRIAEQPTGPLSRRLREYLAWLRWNIEHSVSQELAEPQVRRDEVRAADRPMGLENAQEAPPLLQGLRALERGWPDDALVYFDAAQKQGVDPAILAPHRAAAHFLRRDFRALQDVYRRHPELSVSPRYGSSYRFWQGSVS